MAEEMIRYVAIMEGVRGTKGSSRPVHLCSDPDTVSAVTELIRERLQNGSPGSRLLPRRDSR